MKNTDTFLEKINMFIMIPSDAGYIILNKVKK